MHNINHRRMKNKSNRRISENNKLGLVTGVFRAGLVPLPILLRVESRGRLVFDAGNREPVLLLVGLLFGDTLVGQVDTLAGTFLDMCRGLSFLEVRGQLADLLRSFAFILDCGFLNLILADFH